MKVLRTVRALQKWRQTISGTVGFVPTMGALHQGHLSLVKKSKTQNAKTLVSIFVNPTQFGKNEDFSKYPRTEKSDLNLLRGSGVDAVFIPRNSRQIYPLKESFVIRPPAYLAHVLEGEFRPGHFDGVATVVLKLLNLAQAHRAYFGQKDYQQLQVIRAMVKDLFLKTQIIACPTLREKSGLAMSSRNRYLKPEDQKKAAALSEILMTTKSTKVAKKKLTELGFKVQYLEERALDLEILKNKTSQRLWLVAAIYKGVRLIDNIRRR